jgi:hypothetical protein
MSQLQKFMKMLQPAERINERAANAKFSRMTPAVRSKIQQIDDYLQKNNITID